MELSLLIPTYNEEDIVVSALVTIGKDMPPELVKQTEIIVVDDGKDALPSLVEKEKASLPFASVRVIRNNPPLGKGKSLTVGFNEAQGKIVGFMDVDLSTPPRYIKTAFDVVNSGRADIFIGSRWAAGAKVQRDQSWIKDVLGHTLGVIARNIIFLGMPQYRDTQCGFKFYKRETARLLYHDLCAPDGLNDLEVLLRANLLGLKVMEHGVEWTDLRESKRSLRRILVGELKAMSRILVRYKLGARKQRKILQERASNSPR